MTTFDYCFISSIGLGYILSPCPRSHATTSARRYDVRQPPSTGQRSSIALAPASERISWCKPGLPLFSWTDSEGQCFESLQRSGTRFLAGNFGSRLFKPFPNLARTKSQADMRWGNFDCRALVMDSQLSPATETRHCMSFRAVAQPFGQNGRSNMSPESRSAVLRRILWHLLSRNQWILGRCSLLQSCRFGDWSSS